MIDFRYHIVSLISVFLALAVGIVLGAGPLKEAIGDQLSGQVEGLRADKEQLRTDLDEARSDLAAQDAFVDATASQLVAGTIPGRRVALVELEPVDEAVVTALSERISAAGGAVTSRVVLSDAWVSEGQAKFRQSLATNLTQYVGESGDGSVDTDLARALVQSLVQIDPAKDTAFSSDALVLQELLAAGDLVTYAQADARPADMIVLLSAPAEEDADSTASSSTQRDTTLLLQRQLARVARDGAESAVVAQVGGTTALVDALSGDDADKAKVSTVAGADAASGQITVLLALSAEASGTVGHYGAQSGATAVAPPVVRLADPDRSARTAQAPTPPDGEDADTDADADAADAGAGSDAS